MWYSFVSICHVNIIYFSSTRQATRMVDAVLVYDMSEAMRVESFSLRLGTWRGGTSIMNRGM